MFFGYETRIHKNKFFINLGCSHAASYKMPITESYPYLLAKKFDLGYLDFAYSRTSLEYSEYALNSFDYSTSEFVIWQFTYPWRKHNWNATNRHDARINNKFEMSFKETFSIYAEILYKYKSKNIYYFFINQPYMSKYIKQLYSINNKLYPKNIDFIDAGVDEFHGGPKSQIMIADTLYEFIDSYDKKN